MSNKLRFAVTETDIDANDNESDSREYAFETSFTKRQKCTLVLSSGSVWETLTFLSTQFNSSTPATAIKINTDQSIKVKINSSTTEYVVNKNLIWEGSFTGIDLQNESGLDANVIVEIYG